MELFTKFKIFPIQLLLLITWAFAGLGKFFGGGVPTSFADSFGPTILGKFPGVAVSFYSLAALETIAGILVLVSICLGEFSPKRSKAWLKASIVLSLLLFVQLGFGTRLIGDYAGSASLFFYFAGTLVMLFYVEAQEKSV